MANFEIRTGVIKPVECFKEGWQLIKDRYWLFFGITLVGFLIGSMVPFCLVLGAMMCGIYVPIAEKYHGREPKFEQLFEGFKVFVPSLIATLIWSIPLQAGFLIGYIPLITAQFSMDRKNPDPEILFGALAFSGIVFAVLMLIWIFVHPFLMLTYQILIEQRLSGWESFKLGASAVWKNLGGMVGLLVLNVLAYSLGALVCGIGAYFVLPLIFANTYIAYQKIFHEGDGPNPNPPPPQFYQGI